MKNTSAIRLFSAVFLAASATSLLPLPTTTCRAESVADQEYAAAQYVLGLCYAEGRGVPQDDTEAVKWFRKAADQGSAAAQGTWSKRSNSGLTSKVM